MNKEELYKSMNGIDDEVLLKYYEYKPVSRIINFKKAAVIAASICLLVVAGSAIKLMNNVTIEDGATESIEEAMPETAADTYILEASPEEKGEDMDAMVESEAPEESAASEESFTEKVVELIESLINNIKTFFGLEDNE